MKCPNCKGHELHRLQFPWLRKVRQWICRECNHIFQWFSGLRA